ncbi:hypothetical protein V6N13_057117 [Hibiscus sabdariffa]|uniref:Uncharacterized protein n=1 Tax=Hibiscus sabdariffa TaxID=183260 RepID=A0ABR2AEQ9_9ROSI
MYKEIRNERTDGPRERNPLSHPDVAFSANRVTKVTGRIKGSSLGICLYVLCPEVQVRIQLVTCIDVLKNFPVSVCAFICLCLKRFLEACT